MSILPVHESEVAFREQLVSKLGLGSGGLQISKVSEEMRQALELGMKDAWSRFRSWMVFLLISEFENKDIKDTLPETNSSPLKMDGRPIFRCELLVPWIGCWGKGCRLWREVAIWRARSDGSLKSGKLTS